MREPVGRADHGPDADLISVDDPSALSTEWAGFAAWRARGRLAALIEPLGFCADPELVAAALDAAIVDVRRAADELRAGDRGAAHDGG